MDNTDVVYLRVIQLRDDFYYKQGYDAGQLLEKATYYTRDKAGEQQMMYDLDHVLTNIDSRAKLRTLRVEVL